MKKSVKARVTHAVDVAKQAFTPPAPEAPAPVVDTLPWWAETPGNPIPNDPDNTRFKARRAAQEAEARAKEPPAVKGRPDQIAADEARRLANEGRRAAQARDGMI